MCVYSPANCICCLNQVYSQETVAFFILHQDNELFIKGRTEIAFPNSIQCYLLDTELLYKQVTVTMIYQHCC